MRFSELDVSTSRSNSQQLSSVRSTPSPSNRDPHSIINQLIDVAGISDEFGCNALRIAIVAAIKDGRHVVAEQTVASKLGWVSNPLI